MPPSTATAARSLVILCRAAARAVIGHPCRPFFSLLRRRDVINHSKIFQIITYVVGRYWAAAPMQMSEHDDCADEREDNEECGHETVSEVLLREHAPQQKAVARERLARKAC